MLLVMSEISAFFVKRLTADDKYLRQNSKTFSQQIQMQLSENAKTLSPFFIECLKCKSNCEYFEKKDESPNLSISKITDTERGG